MNQRTSQMIASHLASYTLNMQLAREALRRKQERSVLQQPKPLDHWRSK